MDRKNYDAKVIAVFDHIGSFFVDTFYNSLYLKAHEIVKSGRSGKDSSITDAYRSNVINYMNGIVNRSDLYMVVVKKLHEYYQRSSGFGAVVFSEFEDKVLSQFIPAEYYRDFTEKHKDKTLHEIVIKTVNEFGEVILRKDMLKRVIDDHMNKTNVQLLQDRMMDIFITQREEYYGKFVQEINRNIGNDKVSKKTMDMLKSAFVEEKRKRCEIESEKERAISMISQLVAKINQLEEEIKKLQHNEEALKAQIAKPVEIIVNEPKRRGRPKKTPVIHVSESDDSADDAEEVHRKQRELLAQKHAANTRPSTEVIVSEQKPDPPTESTIQVIPDDDPWA
jgi:hypothetical protein